MTRSCHVAYLANNQLRPEQIEGYATPQTGFKTIPDIQTIICNAKNVLHNTFGYTNGI